MDASSKVKDLIRHSHHMVVATANSEGKPWISPVFYMYDDAFNFYWVSNKSALHSKNVRSNPRVAISIFGPLPSEDPGKIFSAYIDAEAKELTQVEEVAEATKIMQERIQPDKFMIKSLADVTGDAAWRIYKAISKEVTTRQDAIDESSGQAITVRELVIL